MSEPQRSPIDQEARVRRAFVGVAFTSLVAVGIFSSKPDVRWLVMVGWVFVALTVVNLVYFAFEATRMVRVIRGVRK